MIKLKTEVDLHENVDFAQTIKQRTLSDKWQTALIEEENQIINILYKSKSALNIQEIRRHLTLSTIWHIIKYLEEVEIPEEKADLKKIKNQIPFLEKSSHLTSKQHIEMMKNVIEGLNLKNYEDWAYFDFTPKRARGFFFTIYRYIRVYQVYKTFKPTQKQQFEWTEKCNKEKPYAHYVDPIFEVSTIISNKTKAEELFSIILRELNIEIYGFKKMKDILTNLNSLNIILTRKPVSERIKIVYFLNPVVSEYFDNKEKSL